MPYARQAGRLGLKTEDDIADLVKQVRKDMRQTTYFNNRRICKRLQILQIQKFCRIEGIILLQQRFTAKGLTNR
jgi:hypothetical protein